MSIMEYNGAAIVAMIGKNCVAIAADRRLGIQAQTVSTTYQKVFEMNSTLYVGLPGLATDIDTVANLLRFNLNLYQLRENRQIQPKTFMHMVSNLLYSRRSGPYLIEPVIAGLNTKTNEPYIATMDLIGCPMETKDFVVGGTCSEQLYGMCESLWRPDLDTIGPDKVYSVSSFNGLGTHLGQLACLWRCPDREALLMPLEADDLFETISQALLNAVDRDALSGWGAIVHIIYIHRAMYLNRSVNFSDVDALLQSEKDKVTTRTLKARMD